ncbi:alpha-galactosidase [Microbacterium sp. SLBN-146]|uniref:alpha-galactosidase n=1 Tax=Microbacterium sp. SLBN-146 TaxID=2768457 RepID=UPI001151188A|nr:alpha-galactosidase [Microbacterium sp. SLBN-146]TQJ30686.1 alpha-galactosidase [Microbacterium sp. SLBN-146]
MHLSDRGVDVEPLPEPETVLTSDVLHLRRGGTSVAIDLTAAAIVHWGEELAPASPAALASLCVAARPQRVSGGLDRTSRLGLISTAADGWFGTPGLEGHRSGDGVSVRFELEGVQSNDDHALLSFSEDEVGLRLQLELRVGAAGLFHQRATLRNVGDTAYTVNSLGLAFPTPWDSTEVLDTTGHHLRERHPQRRELTIGTHLRESRRGRPGADASLLLAVGRQGFGFETGIVHGIHVAWSGNHRVLAERVNTGESFLLGGELLTAGELILEPGGSYTTPWVIGSWGDGLSELSHRFHDEWRRRPQHPRRARPVTLNTWEAVYFDHRLEKLTALADAAAAVGVERFVLDDGWFRGRRDDTAGLGDWFVDADVWPDGLHPLVDTVTALGMEFGLWVEPEMINPDSDLARAHPDWILRGRMSLPPSARQQQVLDLSHPDAYSYIADRLHALLDEYPIAYLKWDHNRDLVDAASGPAGSARVRAQTLALYRLLDELKSSHAGLEIESCASGGARVDLGILDRTDRIWTSDSLDPLERLANQRYTGIVVPPEMMGMHLTTPTVHSSGRTVDLDLSGAVALFGHFGIEWDLTAIDDASRDEVAGWVALSKRLRPLIANGRVVHGDVSDAAIDVRGVVSADSASAVFTITQISTSAAYPAGRVRLPGLDLDRSYLVSLLSSGREAGQSALEWAQHRTVLTGRELAVVGLRPPVQDPQHAAVVELTAV